MSFLTSYQFRGLELNDSLNYSVPLQGLTFDDHQPVDESWMYRSGGATPVNTAITVKEAVLPLNIHIIAQTAEQFNTRLNALKQLFNPKDPEFYTLERKRSFEANYKGIEVRTKSFIVNPVERKVSITLSCADLTWRDTTNLVTTGADITLNSGNNYEHTFVVTYNGIEPTEPEVYITPMSASSEGPKPMYYQNATVYAIGPQHVLNTPVLVTGNWDCTNEVVAGRMRSDGLDITVTLADGTALKRCVVGAAASRRLWVLPHTWTDAGATVKLQGTATNPLINSSATEIPVLAHTGSLNAIPQAGTICVDSEVISYAGIEGISQDGKYGTLVGCTRGVDGTTAANHDGFHWVKFPTELVIHYGYISAYAGTYFANNLTEWPVLDYALSDNASWRQYTANTSPFIRGQGPLRKLSWRSGPYVPGGSGDYSQADTTGNVEGGTGKMTLRATRSGSGSYRERLWLELLPATSRQVTFATIVLTVTGGDAGQFPTARVGFGTTQSNFLNGYLTGSNGVPYSGEIQHIIGSEANATSTPQDKTLSGNVYQEAGRATHLWVLVTQSPTTSWTSGEYPEAVVIKDVLLAMDTLYGGYPLERHDATVRGAVDGKYPLNMAWQNLSDSQDIVPFELWPRLGISQTAVYNCADYTVTGAAIGDCTFEKPVWLRLLPGNNTIKVTGSPGVGTFNISLHWRERG